MNVENMPTPHQQANAKECIDDAVCLLMYPILSLGYSAKEVMDVFERVLAERLKPLDAVIEDAQRPREGVKCPEVIDGEAEGRGEARED